MTGSWLFVRGDESIWLQRSSSNSFELDMHGPLSLRRHYHFPTCDELREFVDGVTARLVPAGWSVQRFEPGQDRRRVPRGETSNGPERRQSAPAGAAGVAPLET